jgi:hypothetical protein
MRIVAAYTTNYDDQYWRSLFRNDSNQRRKAGLPAWLGVNKQILVEVLALFHRNARFFYTNDLDEPLHRQVASQGHLSLSRARSIDLTVATTPFLWVSVFAETECTLSAYIETKRRSYGKRSPI